ncbi:MAG: hypothetical protein HOK82_23485, partial [Rhodospirillaceae bacterium]|nr:hypothetical protein [Rhodospirillaceae bacterium]
MVRCMSAIRSPSFCGVTIPMVPVGANGREAYSPTKHDGRNKMAVSANLERLISVSAPFWAGEDTGLSSYRLTVFDALPRTGLPDRYESFSEYE